MFAVAISSNLFYSICLLIKSIKSSFLSFRSHTNHFYINNYCYFAWVAIGATSNHKKQNHRSSTVIHRLVAFLPGSMKNKQKFGKETILHSLKISHYTCQQSHYGTHWLMIIVYVCISVI